MKTKPESVDSPGCRAGSSNTTSGSRTHERTHLQCASVVSVIGELLVYFSFFQHFVSERKYDEELGKAARFSCDIEQLKAQIMLCGESKFCMLAK